MCWTKVNTVEELQEKRLTARRDTYFPPKEKFLALYLPDGHSIFEYRDWGDYIAKIINYSLFRG